MDSQRGRLEPEKNMKRLLEGQDNEI